LTNEFFKEVKKQEKIKLFDDKVDVPKLTKETLLLAGGIVLLGAGAKLLGDLK
jgi:hypothetical protein